MAMEFMGYRLQPLPQEEVAIIDFSSISFPNNSTQPSIHRRRRYHLPRTNRESSPHHRRWQDEFITSSLDDQIILNHHPQQYNHFGHIWLMLDDLSYEQRLELAERIGNINIGLSEENITNCLKTRTVLQHQHHHVSTSTSISADLLDGEQKEIFNDTCIVCQDEYKDNDTIGTLKCGHEYHRDCIKEWLLLKNVCPICKRPALSTTTTTS